MRCNMQNQHGAQRNSVVSITTRPDNPPGFCQTHCSYLSIFWEDYYSIILHILQRVHVIMYRCNTSVSILQQVCQWGTTINFRALQKAALWSGSMKAWRQPQGLVRTYKKSFCYFQQGCLWECLAESNAWAPSGGIWKCYSEEPSENPGGIQISLFRSEGMQWRAGTAAVAVQAAWWIRVLHSLRMGLPTQLSSNHLKRSEGRGAWNHRVSLW